MSKKKKIQITQLNDLQLSSVHVFFFFRDYHPDVYLAPE